MSGENVKNFFEQADDTGDNALNLNGSVKINSDPFVLKKVIAASLAEINASKVLVDGITGKQLKVIDFAAIVDGTFAANTSVYLEDESAVVIAALGVAGLADKAVLRPGQANVSFTNLLVALTSGKGIKVVNVGNAATTATKITFVIQYQVI